MSKLATASRWRRGIFEITIVHLPEPGAQVHEGRRWRWQETLCERRCSPSSHEGDDTMRCPDCARIDGELPAGGGSATGPTTARGR